MSQHIRARCLAIAGALLTTALVSCGPPTTNNQTACKGMLPGDLVISEIMGNPAGTDTGHEWFEIYNATSKQVTLKGVRLTVSRADKTGAKDHIMTSGAIAAGGYFVVGDADPKSLPTYENYGYGTSLGSLRNTDGRIAIECGSVVVDETSYATMSSGYSMQLSGASAPDYQANDDPKNWCKSTNEYQTGSFGTPGAANDICQNGPAQTVCDDNGTTRNVVPPQAGDVVISEIMPNPSAVSDSNGEWFEVAVLNDVDLNGLQVGETPGTPKLTLSDTSCIHAAAGAYVVFARNADTTLNGGLPPPVGTFSFGLTNSGGTLFIGYNDTVLDQASWTNAPTGASIALDPGHLDPTANDDPANWCDGTTSYGLGDLGTPGTVNIACPVVVPAGSCDDNGTVRPIVSPQAGDLQITEYMADPSKVADATGEWFEVLVKSDVDLNGIGIGTNPATGAVQQTLDTSKCIHAAAGTYLVFAESTDPTANGGLPSVDVTETLTLANTSGGLFLSLGGTMLDQVTYTSTTTGASASLDPAVANKWCPGTTAYGQGDLGTPGAANPSCP